ncbi:MAG TPA: NAD(P)H-hydrate dehydratase [Chloroflexota bacterium]|nr:NAD(P)H-hydrate dehydratase [Chloroflexota bacterium]
MSTPVEITTALLRSMPLPDYSPEAHKGDYGKLLVIAGSRQLPGAPILVARAALRAGCGSVRVAAPKSIAVQIGIAFPELMVVPLPETDHGALATGALAILEDLYAPCDAAVIGPGLGQHAQTRALIHHVIGSATLPLAIDAEALHALGAIERVERKEAPPAPRVYTPHPTEMSWLMDADPEEINRNRESTSLEFVRYTGGTLILKGRHTLITSTTGEQYVNTAGTRGLATAGSGDTLVGITASLLAQGMEPTHAAIWAVHLHALAGEAAARDLGEDGLLSSDFTERLPRVVHALREQTS